MLNPHGHAATGRLHDDNVASYQARGITFARMGCVALIWDLADLFIPGLLRAGGFPNAVALLAPRAVLVQNTGNTLDTSSAVQAFGTSAVTEGWSRLKLESTVQGDSAIHAFLEATIKLSPNGGSDSSAE